jgi:threonine synthase
MVSVTDLAASETMGNLARSEGIAVEPASAVAFAGLRQLVKLGIVKSDEVVVVNASGHTSPREKHTFNLQVAEAQPLDALAESHAEQLRDTFSRISTTVKHILVINPSAEDRALIRAILYSRTNYRLSEVKTGEDGLAAAEREVPDLIILDMSLPTLSCFEVLVKLADNPITTQIPVILISAERLSPSLYG